MTVVAVFAAIALVFALYFDQPACRLRGEPPCTEEQEATTIPAASSEAEKRDTAP